MQTFLKNILAYIKSKYKKVSHYLVSAFKLFNRNSIGLLPANIAFFTLWSLIPIMILWDFLFKLLPAGVNTEIAQIPMLPEIQDSISIEFSVSFDSILLLIVILYLASKPFHAVVISTDYIYESKKRNNKFISFFKSVVFAIIIAITYVVMFIIQVLGDDILNFIKNNFGNIKLFTQIETVKGPITFIFLLVVLYIIFYLAPSERKPVKYFVPGAVFTSLTWMISTNLYSVYVTSYADYQKIYSSFTNVIALMIWLYIISYLFIIGLVVNAAYYGENRHVYENIE